MDLIQEIKNILKLSTIKNSARFINSLTELQRGDLIAIAEIEEQFRNPEVALEFGVADNLQDFYYRDIGVVDRVQGNNVYIWTGKGEPITQASPDRYVDAYWIAAINKYQKFMMPEAGKPTSRSIIRKVDPTLKLQTVTILLTAEEVRNFIQSNLKDIVTTNKIPEKKSLPIQIDDSRLGIRYNANRWSYLKTCSIPEINAMFNDFVDPVDGLHIYRDMIFDYVRKLKRHYLSPNTVSNNRFVRPHFMYTEKTMPGNQYLLTMDRSGSPGEWRSFLITDVDYGQRMTNIRFGQPFKFNKNILMKVKGGLKTIKNKLMKDSSSVEEYLEKKNSHRLYNGLRLYYKYLRKTLKDENKKEASIFKPRMIKQGKED